MAYIDPKTHEREPIRLCELVAGDGVLDGHTFVECHIKGPAILALLGEPVLTDCDFGGDASQILWEVDTKTRPSVVGVIVADHCTFVGCVFEGVGFAGDHELIELIRTSGDN
jgi:hypothetical protein